MKGMKRHTKTQKGLFGIVLGLVILGLAGAGNAQAQTTQTEQVDVKFTLNPTMTLTIEGGDEMKIEGLNPGSYKDSNEITLKADTNAAGGFYLTATAGTKETDTNLKMEGGSKSIASIAAGSPIASMEAAGDNTWGFAFANTSDALKTSQYYGLKLDGDDVSDGEAGTGLRLLDINDTDREVKCKIGVKAGSDLAAGTYQNVVNFYVVTNN